MNPASFAESALPLVDGLYTAAMAAGADDAAARAAVAAVLDRVRERFPAEGKGGDFKTWLFMSLREESRGKAWEFGPPPPGPADDASPAEPDLAGLDAAALQAVTSALPPVQRLLLVLCDREGLGYREAAGVLKSTPGDVAASLRLARRAIRSAL